LVPDRKRVPKALSLKGSHRSGASRSGVSQSAQRNRYPGSSFPEEGPRLILDRAKLSTTIICGGLKLYEATLVHRHWLRRARLERVRLEQ